MKIDFDKIEENAKNIDGHLEYLNNCITTLDEMVKNTKTYWNGSDEQEFEARANFFIKELQGALETLKNYNEYFRSYKEANKLINSYYKSHKIELK